jgi:hypothetical protein
MPPRAGPRKEASDEDEPLLPRPAGNPRARESGYATDEDAG